MGGARRRRPGGGPAALRPDAALLRIVGIALLVVPFLPLEALFGEIHGAGAMVPPAEWALGLAIFGAAAWVLALLAGDRIDAARERVDRALAADGARSALGAGLLAALLLAVSWFVFRHRPLLVDSVVQLFQAEIFAGGMATAPAPADRAFFATLHMVVDGGRWYSQYPPGWSALLVPGVLAGAPWTVPIALTVGAFLFLVAFARTAWDRATANLVAALLLLCPFFWFMGASFMNHVPTLFFVAAFLYGFARWEARGGTVSLVGAGAALGAAFLARPMTALAVGAAFAVFATGVAWREGRGRDLAAGVVAFLAVAALYPAWNLASTGDPLVPGYVRLWGASHGLGFHATPWGELHTPVTGLRNELADVSLLNVFLFEWPIPSLLPVGALLAAGGGTGRWERRLVLAFLALPAAYFFYWHRDAYLGPRYLYSGVAFLVPLTARALIVGFDRLRGRRIGLGSTARPVRATAWATGLVALAALYALGWGIPQRFAIYATGRSSMKVDVVAEARRAGLAPGLVFVKTSWGNRLLAELYGLGVPAPVVERVYRRADHCELQRIADRARAEGWPSARLVAALDARVVPPERLVAPGLNRDPTLRLRPDRPIPPACADEIRYDLSGYTVYVAHLPANAPDLSGPWIVARDLRDRNADLRRLHPDRPAYLFTGQRMVRLTRGE